MALQIGVTGGIGSGKSIVCRIFAALGIPVYDADSRAKWLISNDLLLKKSIIELLGDDAYLPDGTYNRVWVATAVFQDPTLLQKLNSLVHPRVWQDTTDWAEANQNASYLIKEAALMSRASKTIGIDKLIVVHAPVAMRVARVKHRDPHRTTADIEKIIASQMTDEERFKVADYIIDNDEKQLLIPQVLDLHRKFLSL